MWAKFLKDTVIKPLLRRAGTAAAVWLVLGGDWMCQHWQACGLVNEAGATMVANYLVAVALLCFDLMVSWADKQSFVRRVLASFGRQP